MAQLAVSGGRGVEKDEGVRVAAPPVLETRGLSKAFGGLAVANNINISLMSGELRVIIGPNGAGKTTLFNLITGALRPDSGEVLLKGEPITSLEPSRRYRKGLARSFQITNVFPDLAVRENIWLCINSLSKRPWNFIQGAHRDTSLEAQIVETAALVGLDEKLDIEADLLSQADQRLLEIAMALSSKPDVILLDEPTQGVGTKEVEDLNAVIRGLAKITTVLVIEHNMDCVMEIAHKITVLANGTIMAEGTCDDIVCNQEVQRIYLGTS